MKSSKRRQETSSDPGTRRNFEGSPRSPESYQPGEKRPEEWRERRTGADDWYQGFPESRGFAHRDWERERDYWNPASESSFGRAREDYGYGGDYESGMQGASGRFDDVGPQGYKRSDERIVDDINEMLTRDPDVDPTDIVVDVQNGEVTLKGTVSDRESKRRAEDIAESCSGVRDVQNQLRIKRRDEGGEKPRSHRIAS